MDPSYNNSFGSAGNAVNSGVNGLPQMEVSRQQVISSGSGDVVLSSPKGNAGKRRWPIVVAVILCLVAIAAGVGAVMVNSGGNSSVPSEARNLVLYGYDEMDYPMEGAYAIQDVMNWDEDTTREYYEKIDAAMGDAMRNDILQAVKLWMDVSWFYEYYDDDLILVYEENGYDAGIKYIDDKYKKFINSTDAEVVAAGKEMVKLEKKYLEYVQKFENTGCKILDLTEECDVRADEVGEEAISEIDAEILDVYEKAWNILNGAIERIKR